MRTLQSYVFSRYRCFIEQRISLNDAHKGIDTDKNLLLSEFEVDPLLLDYELSQKVAN